MDEALEKVLEELSVLGYQPSIRESPQGMVVEFDYCVVTGSHTGETFGIGLSFQEAAYPEYPPHWIHISPPVWDGLGTNAQHYQTANGKDWVALSRPPSDLWDKLPKKNMKSYLETHLRRFWNNI